MSDGFLSSFGLDPSFEATMRTYGYVLSATSGDNTRKLFAETKDLSLPEGSVCHLEVPYGDHERQRVDICSQPEGGCPVVLFVPGGGFVGGDKALYRHIPAFLAREGLVGVAMNYRLAPDHLFPAGAEDVSAALDWIAANIRDYGGDPERLLVIAQSAGAVHAASSVFDPRYRPACFGALKAVALMSGFYKIYPDMPGPNLNLYFGNDAAECADRAPVRHVETCATPVIMTQAELEPEFFGEQAAALYDALNRRNGHAPAFALLKGHNHQSPVLGMGSRTDLLGRAILAELRRYV